MFRMSRLTLAIAVLVLASLACQAVGGGTPSQPEKQPPVEATKVEAPDEQPTEEASAPEATEEPADDGGAETEGGLGFETEFPVPDDAFNGMELGADMINFQTKMSVKDALEFYRAELTAEGYTEREITTVVTDGMFSIVFDGHDSGKAIVVQAVDLGDGTVNIIINLQDI